MTPTPLARSILARAERPIPRYGSAEWNALPEHDLRRVAAVLVAAEAWREHCSPARVAADLREQLLEDDRLVLARIRSVSADVRAGLPQRDGGWRWRVAAAEACVRQMAREHYDAFTAEQDGQLSTAVDIRATVGRSRATVGRNRRAS